MKVFSYLEIFEVPFLLCQFLLAGLDLDNAFLLLLHRHEAPEAVLDRLEPVVPVYGEEVLARQEALHVLVERLQDHKDGGNLLVEVPHHGQGHGLDQVVPREGIFCFETSKPHQ